MDECDAWKQADKVNERHTIDRPSAKSGTSESWKMLALASGIEISYSTSAPPQYRRVPWRGSHRP
jgi:hypothetical protein